MQYPPTAWLTSTSILHSEDEHHDPDLNTRIQPHRLPNMRHSAASPEIQLLTVNEQAFENTSTNVAAAQMRNALTNLSETVTDPVQKKVDTSDTYKSCFGC